MLLYVNDSWCNRHPGARSRPLNRILISASTGLHLEILSISRESQKALTIKVGWTEIDGPDFKGSETKRNFKAQDSGALAELHSASMMASQIAVLCFTVDSPPMNVKVFCLWVTTHLCAYFSSAIISYLSKLDLSLQYQDTPPLPPKMYLLLAPGVEHLHRVFAELVRLSVICYILEAIKTEGKYS